MSNTPPKLPTFEVAMSLIGNLKYDVKLVGVMKGTKGSYMQAVMTSRRAAGSLAVSSWLHFAG